jgi:tol-pal system protein YbgF
MRRALALAAGFCLLTPLSAFAADLEGRVTRLENILENQRPSDVLLQIQRLQAEIQLLRGMVEQQQFDLEDLQRKQRDQYLDLDGRLRAAGSVAPPADTEAPGVQGQGPARGDAILAPREPRAGAGGRASEAGPGPTAAPGTDRPTGEREAYRSAFDLLKQRRYDEAVAAFNGLLARYPNGDLADNARYWLGEAYYVKRDHSAALAEFQRVLEDYPLSPKAAGSMLKIGYIQDDQRDWEKARATLEGLIARFPDSTEARLAQGRLERMARDGR